MGLFSIVEANALYAFKSRGFGGEIGVDDFPDYRKGIPTQPPRTKVAAKSRKVSLKDFKFLLGVGLGWTHFALDH